MTRKEVNSAANDLLDHLTLHQPDRDLRRKVLTAALRLLAEEKTEESQNDPEAA